MASFGFRKTTKSVLVTVSPFVDQTLLGAQRSGDVARIGFTADAARFVGEFVVMACVVQMPQHEGAA